MALPCDEYPVASRVRREGRGPITAPPVSPDDLDLMRRIAAGDRDAHRQIYERHGRGVLSFLMGRLGDRSAAEEILQEVMLAVWQGAGEFRGDSSVRTWLLAIALKRAHSRMRRLGRERALAPSDVVSRNGTSSRLNGADVRIDLHTALHRLPDGQRAAVELLFFHGLTVEEAGQALGIAPGTVKSRIHRAKAALRAWLDTEASHV